MIRSAIATILALSFTALSAPAPAQQALSDLARAELMSGWRDGGTHVAGLTIRLSPGWKTYWRAPGDAGIPPSFNWSGSRNIKSVKVQFPVPEVMDQNGFRSIGYHDDVTFPLWIEPRDASAPISLQGEIEIGVCEEICVPVTLQVSGTLPASGQRGGPLSTMIGDRPDRATGLRCDIAPIADGLRLSATVALPRMSGEEVAVIETGDPDVWVSPPVVTRNGGILTAEAEMVPPSAKPFALARSDVRMTVLAGGRAVEMLGCD